MVKAWDKYKAQLSVVFEFDRFVQAAAFIQECAEEMERQNHHASIQWEYCTIKMQLTTHDAGNTLTSKDWDLSEAISRITKRPFSFTVDLILRYEKIYFYLNLFICNFCIWTDVPICRR